MLKLIAILLILFQINIFAQKTNSFLFTPSGNYSIGTCKIYLTDSSRKEMVKKSSNNFRKIYIKVWYPSDIKDNINYNNYFSDYSTKTIYQIFKSKGITKQELDSIKKYKTHSIANLKISDKEERFPLIIFNSGFYFGMTDLYTNYMELLASNGYIVFSIIHTYQQPVVFFPNGEKAKLLKNKARLAFLQWKLRTRKQINKFNTLVNIEEYIRKGMQKLTLFEKITRLWSKDNQFVLNSLERINSNKNSFLYNKIDLSNIGGLGQSIGGAAIGQLTVTDKRIKAGVNIDCLQFGDIINTNLQTPFMLIESEYKKRWNIGNSYIYSKTKENFYSLSLLNTTHFINSDAPLLPTLTKEQQCSFYGDVNGKAILELTNTYILKFFNLYLKNISSNIIKTNVTNNDIIYKVR